MAASLATLVWANFGNWLRVKSVAFLGMGTSADDQERQNAAIQPRLGREPIEFGLGPQIAELDRKLAEVANRLGKAASRDDLKDVRAWIEKLEKPCEQGAKAFRVMEAKAQIQHLKRMQEVIDRRADGMLISRE